MFESESAVLSSASLPEEETAFWCFFSFNIFPGNSSI